MKIQSQFLFGIQSGASGINKHRTSSMASIVTTAACLMLIGCLYMLGSNIQANIDQFQADNTMLAFVDDRLTRTEALEIQPKLEEIPGVKEVAFIGREEVFEDYMDQYESTSPEHIQPSVFRDRYSITVGANVDAKPIADIVLHQVPGIGDVRLDEALTNGFAAIQKVVFIIGAFLTILLLSLSAVIMANTIKLSTLARKEELEIMKMMGAYDSFVRLPFICEGCIIGSMGAIVAFLLTIVVYQIMSGLIGQTGILSLISVLSFSDMAVPMLVIMLVMGLGVGAAGSFIAIRKHLTV